jgi:hypothetical protein
VIPPEARSVWVITGVKNQHVADRPAPMEPIANPLNSRPPVGNGLAARPDSARIGARQSGLDTPLGLTSGTRPLPHFLFLNRNHLFCSICCGFAHNALPTQRDLPNWPVREQLMEAIKANLLSHQLGSFGRRSRGP